MQYTITHTCGHSETVDIYGTNSHGERERKAEWMRSQPCQDCRRTTETAQALESAQARGLPTLTGSEKQIAWAERIRAAFVARMTDEIAKNARVLSREDAERAAQQAEWTRAALTAAVSAQTSAAWWIDHREGERRALLPVIQAAYERLSAEVVR